MSKVAIVSTPDDGSCGIGTYTGDLIDGFPPEVEEFRHTLRVGAWNPIHFIYIALSAGFTDGDVIHVQHEYGLFGPVSYASLLFFPILGLLSQIRGLPVIVTFHSAWNGNTVDSPPIRVKQLYIHLVNRVTVLAADHCVFLSKNCMREFAQSISINELSIYTHGVNQPEYNTSKQKAKEQFGYTNDDLVVTLPGYVRPEKGTDTFVEIADHFNDVEFLVAGGARLDGLSDYLKQIERDAPTNVQITGVLNEREFHHAFIASDAVLLPYIEMTQSGIFNWCATYSVPVLASDHAYFEQLADEWGCVETAPADDLEQIESQLRILLEDDEKRAQISDAISTYADINSFEYVAECHIGLYNWVLEEKAPDRNRIYRFVRSVYDWTIRQRLPRKIASLNGVPARQARLLDSTDTIPEYEDPNVQALSEHIHEGDDILIIGGGWGVTSAVAARKAGNQGGVTTFEASREYAEYVRETVSLSRVSDRVTVVEKAVGEGIFFYGESDTSVHSPAKLPDCDIVEIDAEGAEVDIISKLSISPETIIVETHACYAAPTPQVKLLLHQKGYKIVSQHSELPERGVNVLVAKAQPVDEPSEVTAY